MYEKLFKHPDCREARLVGEVYKYARMAVSCQAVHVTAIVIVYRMSKGSLTLRRTRLKCVSCSRLCGVSCVHRALPAGRPIP